MVMILNALKGVGGGAGVSFAENLGSLLIFIRE